MWQRAAFLTFNVWFYFQSATWISLLFFFTKEHLFFIALREGSVLGFCLRSVAVNLHRSFRIWQNCTYAFEFRFSYRSRCCITLVCAFYKYQVISGLKVLVKFEFDNKIDYEKYFRSIQFFLDNNFNNNSIKYANFLWVIAAFCFVSNTQIAANFFKYFWFSYCLFCVLNA